MSRLRNLWQSASVSPSELRRYRDFDFVRVQRLHFVCKGNVCRSAYAEYRARQWGFPASSSGVDAGLDKPADGMARRVAAERRVPLEEHATRPLAEVNLGPDDLIVAMEPWHARAALAKAHDCGAQVTLLGLWRPRPLRVIRDPYGYDEAIFHRCFAEIDASLQRLIAHVRGLYHAADDHTLAARPTAGERFWRRTVKPVIGRALYGSGLYRWFLRDRAVIVAFHSIIPGRQGDSLRTPLARFEEYIDFFRRHFEVVPLEDLLDRMARGADISRCLAVTFDDGYADNYELAAPALEAAGVSATFFISTGFIGSDVQAPWDSKKGRRSTWMTWQQVRDLASRGHEISAHTVTHADVGRLTGDALAGEVRGSMDAIEQHVGARPRTFAVPFGRPASVTDEVKALCASNGIRGCVTAVGGSVTPQSPPIGLNRFPVDVGDAISVYSSGIDILADCLTVTRRHAARPDS